MIGVAIRSTMAFLLFAFILLLLVAGSSSSAIKNLSAVTFRLQSCGAVGRFGPSTCTEFYRLQESPVADHLQQSTAPGAQLFRVPRSGLYNVTVAGASGGDGVCHPPGRGKTLLATFNFTQGQELKVFVGQKGSSGCKHPSGAFIPFCQLWANIANLVNCTEQWFLEFLDRGYLVFDNDNLVAYEGGGGGGGASLVQLVSGTQPLIAAAGGGGGGAAYSQTVLSDFLQDNPGFQSNAFPPPANPNDLTGLSGWTFEQPLASAGVGAGYRADPRTTDATDGGPFSSDRGPTGGADCLDVHGQPTPLLHSGGGFGGGGGGCENGGGGGGYSGGRVSNYENDESYLLPGEGGHSYIFTDEEGFVHSYTDLGFNDGEGYVEILPLNCLCTGECLIVDDSFCCNCPDYTMLAPDGFDCFKDAAVTLENPHMVATEYGNLVHHAISPLPSSVQNSDSEEQSETSIRKLFVLSVYSVEVVISVEPAGGSGNSSSGCVLLLVDGDGQVTATSEWIPVSGGSSPYNQMVNSLLPLIQADNTSLLGNASRYLDTPVAAVYLTVLSVGLQCELTSATVDVSILESDIVNVSTQLNPTGVAGLIQMLAPPPPPATTNTPVGLTTGALAGVVIAGLVAVVACLVALLLSAVAYFLLRRKRLKSVGLLEKHGRKSFGSDYQNAEVLTLFRNPLHRRHTYTTIPVVDLKFGVAAPEGTDFTAFNLARATANLKEWEYPRENLTYLRELGEGQFGKVHLMKAKDICGYKGMLPVAVKTLSTLKKDEMEKFYEEIEMMRTFTHPNIVSLLGMCSEVEDGPPMLILELMEYGDLRSFLLDNEPKENEAPRLGLPQLYSFAADVANALVFLMSKQYIHRDIAARNCLVGQGLLVKLADFGLARGLQDQEYYRLVRATKLPLRWMAPECIFYGTFVQESDIWSFGVLLWEIITYCDQPYGELDPNELVARIEKKSLSLPCPPACPPEYFAKIQQCQEYDPVERPSMTDLHQFFTSRANELKEAITDSVL